MLEVKNLSACRGKKQVLRNINLELLSGTLTVIIGKNGSGKSSLCECINATVSYSGKILFSGEDAALLPPRKRARYISYLPQTLRCPHITVEELVSLGRTPYVGVSGRLTEEDREKCLQASKELGLEAVYNKFVDEISGGERQKAYLAMMLAQDSDVLMLDEPTSHMDIEVERAFADTLRILAKKGKAVLAVMHNINLAADIADRIIVMSGGEIVFGGKREESLRCEIIEKEFGVRRFDAAGKSFFAAGK